MMKLLNKVNYKILSRTLLALVIAAAVCCIVFIKPAYASAFTLAGDVENPLKVSSMEGYDTFTAMRNGQGFKSLSLKQLVGEAAPFSGDYTVVIRGDDGLMAETVGNQLDGMYIAYTAQNAWEMINENHPPSSNIKRITEILVVSNVEKRRWTTSGGGSSIPPPLPIWTPATRPKTA